MCNIRIRKLQLVPDEIYLLLHRDMVLLIFFYFESNSFLCTRCIRDMFSKGIDLHLLKDIHILFTFVIR